MHIPDPDITERLAKGLRIGATTGAEKAGFWTAVTRVPLETAVLFPDRELLAGTSPRALTLHLLSTKDPRALDEARAALGGTLAFSFQVGGESFSCVLHDEPAPEMRLAVRVHEPDGVVRLACWLQGDDFHRTYAFRNLPDDPEPSKPFDLPDVIAVPGGRAAIVPERREIHLFRVGSDRTTVISASFGNSGWPARPVLAAAKIVTASLLPEGLRLFLPHIRLRSAADPTPRSLQLVMRSIDTLQSAIAAEATRRDSTDLLIDSLQHGEAAASDGAPTVREAEKLVGASTWRRRSDIRALVEGQPLALAERIDVVHGNIVHEAIARTSPSALLRGLVVNGIIGDLVQSREARTACTRGRRYLERALAARTEPTAA